MKIPEFFSKQQVLIFCVLWQANQGALAILEQSQALREEYLSNHHVGSRLDREAWNKLQSEVPSVEDCVVYKNAAANDDDEDCEEGGNRHPWLVGVVLSKEKSASEGYVFRVHEMGWNTDLFSQNNKYALWFKETKKAKKQKPAGKAASKVSKAPAEYVTLDVYETNKRKIHPDMAYIDTIRAKISTGMRIVESTITFANLAWWGKKPSVLKADGSLRNEVLKELSSNKRIKWQLPKGWFTCLPCHIRLIFLLQLAAVEKAKRKHTNKGSCEC
jgi:hypothetical protein